MIIVTLIFCCFALLFTVHGFPSPPYKEDNEIEDPTAKPLLVFLIDGFRWDYLDIYDLGELPGFQRFLASGTKAEYLIPDYVSDSYPNYYTLMTGLYTENHGMVHNYMWDPLYPDEEFVIGSNEDQYNSHWWNDAEPLWITAEKQNQSVYMWFWPGCEVEIQGHRPSFCMPYQDHSNPSPGELAMAIESALHVLANRTATIAGIYYERIDYFGHAVGPYRLDEPIRSLDEQLNQMFALIDDLGLSETINVVLFTDHGMSNFTRGNLIHLPDFINETDYERLILGGTTTQIWPNDGELDTLYNKLKGAHPHLQVYKRQEIPDEWHNSNHRRISPLFLAADVDWIMTDRQRVGNTAYHGYNISHSDMWGVFLMYGSSFQENHTIKGLGSVNVYQVLCHVTQVECLAHNGTWDQVCEVFSKDDACGRTSLGEALAEGPKIAQSDFLW